MTEMSPFALSSFTFDRRVISAFYGEANRAIRARNAKGNSCGARLRQWSKQSGGSGKPRVGDVEYSTDYPFPSVPGCIGASGASHAARTTPLPTRKVVYSTAHYLLYGVSFHSFIGLWHRLSRRTNGPGARCGWVWAFLHERFYMCESNHGHGQEGKNTRVISADRRARPRNTPRHATPGGYCSGR
ncbi:hypothetical protein BJV77DRAFT_976514 [Russula vinacea]|nr:hypothetical protein BJV77DRAFT_976514 [Russula vinacea]